MHASIWVATNPSFSPGSFCQWTEDEQFEEGRPSCSERRQLLAHAILGTLFWASEAVVLPIVSLIESTKGASTTEKSLALLQVRDLIHGKVLLCGDPFVVFALECWRA
jgi:hypothetical protein